MPPTSTRPLVDRLIPGGLREFLTLARQNGDSYNAIALRLHREHDVAITSTTVRSWCIELEIADPAELIGKGGR